jgi:hypothetical protein
MKIKLTLIRTFKIPGKVEWEKIKPFVEEVNMIKVYYMHERKYQNELLTLYN